MAHMIWGVGGILNTAGGRWPVFDFAGGTVVHITSASRRLSAAFTWQARRLPATGYAAPLHGAQLHRRSYAVGRLVRLQRRSALGAGPLATSAFINTQFAAAAGAIGWVVAEWMNTASPRPGRHLRRGPPDWPPSPGSGFVQPMSALLIGLIAGVVCPFMVFRVKSSSATTTRSTLLAFTGVGGTMGALFTGLLASGPSTPSSAGCGRPSAGHGRHRRQLASVVNQAIGAGIGWVLAIVGTIVLLFLVDKSMGLRVTPATKPRDSTSRSITRKGTTSTPSFSPGRRRPPSPRSCCCG